MNTIEQLEKAIELQEVSKGQLIICVKPKNKNNVIVFDTDTSCYEIIKNELVLSFGDSSYKDINIRIGSIKSIKIEKYEDMIITFISLKSGNTIMIHSFME
jgi:hypothetical protein